MSVKNLPHLNTNYINISIHPTLIVFNGFRWQLGKGRQNLCSFLNFAKQKKTQETKGNFQQISIEMNLTI